MQESFEHIEAMNAQRSHEAAAIYGLTQFADMTRDEFTAAMLTKRKMMRVARPKAVPFGALLQLARNRTARALIETPPAAAANPDDSTTAADITPPVELAADGLPVSFSWLDAGRTTPVRDQGACGACWAHSVIETIESMAAIEHGAATVAPLSVQQMIDCAAGINHGCAGGDTCNLLQWLVLNNVPIATERSYPQTGVQRPCSVERVLGSIRGSGAGAAGAARVRAFTCENLVGQEDRMVEYLARVGPLTVGVNAASWQYYLDGVIQHHCEAGGAAGALLNHAVQVVGYDRSGELPHFIVRNSWGERFGDRGMVRIRMGGNVCGIASQVSAVSVV